MDIETHYYRTPDGTQYRVRIVQDLDPMSPRDAHIVDWDAGVVQCLGLED